MHKLIEYVCDELDELERKAEKGGKLSMQEIQYADTLAHMKKNLLTADAMMEAEDHEYSNTGYSYARGRGSAAKRDSMGRYSSDYYRYRNMPMYSRDEAKDYLMHELKEMEHNADEESKRMIQKWMRQLEQD